MAWVKGSIWCLAVLLVVLGNAAQAVGSQEAPVDSIQAPTWEHGQWWRVGLHDPMWKDGETEVKVVALREANGVRLALTEENWRYVFGRTFPLGAVSPSNFSFRVDNITVDSLGNPPPEHPYLSYGSFSVNDGFFEALRFPLQKGATWKTHLGLFSVDASVLDVQDGAASITYVITNPRKQGPAPHPSVLSSLVFNATYDEKSAFFTKLEAPNGMSLILREQGKRFYGRLWEPVDPRLAYVPDFDDGNVPNPDAVGTGSYASTRPWEPYVFDGGFRRTQTATVVHLRMRIQPRETGSYSMRFQEDALPTLGLLWQTYEIANGPRSDGSIGLTSVSPLARYATDLHPSHIWNLHVRILGNASAFAEVITAAGVREYTIDDEGYGAFFHAGSEMTWGGRSSTPASVWLGLGVMGVGLLLVGVWRLFGWVAARIRAENALDHDTRKAIVGLIGKDPGITTQEICRRLELPWTTASHHLRLLEDRDLIQLVRHGRGNHWFEANWGFQRDREAIAVLRSPPTRHVHDFLLSHPGLSLSRIAKDLGVRHTTARFHLRRLEDVDLVARRLFGRRHRFIALPRPNRLLDPSGDTA